MIAALNFLMIGVWKKNEEENALRRIYINVLVGLSKKTLFFLRARLVWCVVSSQSVRDTAG